MQVNRGVRYSTMLHGGLLLVFILGLPHFQKEITHTPSIISIDILPDNVISNAHQKTPPKIADTPLRTTPLPPKATNIQNPVPARATPVLPVKQPEASLQDILNAVKNTRMDADKAIKDTPAITHTSAIVTTSAPASENPNQNMPLSMTEKDRIKKQIEDKWNVPTGAKDAQNLIVQLLVRVSSDGTVTSIKHIGDEARYASEYNFRAAVDSAILAVRRASPLQNLPTDRYSSWREMELVFNPADVAN